MSIKLSDFILIKSAVSPALEISARHPGAITTGSAPSFDIQSGKSSADVTVITASGLTPEELAERDKLRRIYIDSVKGNLIGQLENTYLVRPDGTKEKLERKGGK